MSTEEGVSSPQLEGSWDCSIHPWAPHWHSAFLLLMNHRSWARRLSGLFPHLQNPW